MCLWCKQLTSSNRLCRRCAIIETHAKELGKEVAILTRKGGVQLYIAIEKTGSEKRLLSVKRWSPLEPLEDVESAEQSLVTSQ